MWQGLNVRTSYGVCTSTVVRSESVYGIRFPNGTQRIMILKSWGLTRIYDWLRHLCAPDVIGLINGLHSYSESSVCLWRRTYIFYHVKVPFLVYTVVDMIDTLDFSSCTYTCGILLWFFHMWFHFLCWTHTRSVFNCMGRLVSGPMSFEPMYGILCIMTCNSYCRHLWPRAMTLGTIIIGFPVLEFNVP